MKLRFSDLTIQTEKAWLNATLAHAPDVRGLVLVVQTSLGSARDSRESHAAKILQRARYATLVVDLINRFEDSRDPDIRFNIPLQATRITQLFDWIGHQPPLQALPLGMLAAGNAGGAAIRACSQAECKVRALVCRGGRPDLAGSAPLRAMRHPTRFVVGRDDPNRSALEHAFQYLGCVRDWVDLPGAGELFLEPGALDDATSHAVEWMDRHLTPLPQPSRISESEGP